MKDFDADVGGVDGGDDWEIVVSRARRVVVADRAQQRVRQVPFDGEQPADFAVRDVHYFLFGFNQMNAFLLHQGENFCVLARKELVENEDADVVKESGNECFLGHGGECFLCDRAGHDGGCY